MVPFLRNTKDGDLANVETVAHNMKLTRKEAVVMLRAKGLPLIRKPRIGTFVKIVLDANRPTGWRLPFEG